MIPNCPRFSPVLSISTPFPPHHVVRKGFFRRKCDSRWIQRFWCKSCGAQFSRSTLSPRYRQKVRRINAPLLKHLASGGTQARAALLLGVDPKTIARRSCFLALQARRSQKRYLESLSSNSIRSIQFDDLESSIHTKCKPVSVAIAVEPKTRKILGFQVSEMPAKGLLARVARRKYGPRKDRRGRGWDALLKALRPIVSADCEVTSDENPHYPKWVQKHLPQVKHVRVPGGRGAVTGQSELRARGFDPMFALNHTCAMLRANINRLFRRTWSTSKRMDRLAGHIAIYVDFHNRVLTPPYPPIGGS